MQLILSIIGSTFLVMGAISNSSIERTTVEEIHAEPAGKYKITGVLYRDPYGTHQLEGLTLVGGNGIKTGYGTAIIRKTGGEQYQLVKFKRKYRWIQVVNAEQTVSNGKILTLANGEKVYEQNVKVETSAFGMYVKCENTL